MPKAAIHNPYWDSLGGGERYSAAFVKLLLNEGWQVDIWWPADISKSVKDRFDIDISSANFLTPPKNYFLSTINYQLVFWVSDGSLPTSWAKKTLIHFQFPFIAIGKKSWSNIIKSRFYTFVANSKFTKKIVDSEFSINSDVIYPPVSITEIKPGKKENIILYVGRFSNLTQAKGHQALIDVFKGISKQIPGWKMILTGGSGVGTDEVEMKQLINSIGSYPIDIVINPTWAELKKLYSKSKIYCSPSGYGVDEKTEPLKIEHFGITVVEAMAAGVVPVVINAGGHKETVIDKQSGFLWNTLDELKVIILELAGDDSKLKQISAQAMVRSKLFSTQVFNQNYSRLL